jgi:hypothetical protein
MTITRSVILDLWPLYVSGDASDDTRTLVDVFLRDDPAFARELATSADLPAIAPALPPDLEIKALDRLKRRLSGYPFLLNMAILFTCFAFGRIVSDTSFDVSPRRFIITAAIAVALWIAYFVSLWRMRARILCLPERAPRGKEKRQGRSDAPMR